jgi:hypothetical protein
MHEQEQLNGMFIASGGGASVRDNTVNITINIINTDQTEAKRLAHKLLKPGMITSIFNKLRGKKSATLYLQNNESIEPRS